MNQPNLPDVPDGTEEAELSAAKKELRTSVTALVVVSVLLLSALVSWLVLNFAWFANASQVSGEGMSVGVQKPASVAYTLQHQVGAGWENVDRVLIEDALPGQSEVYRLLLSNSSSDSYRVTLQLKEFTVDGLSEGITGDFRLGEKLLLAVKTPGAAAFTADASLSTRAGGTLAASSIVDLGTVTLPGNVAQGSEEHALTFRLTLDENTNTDPADMTDGKYTDYMKKGLAASQIALSAVENNTPQP